MSIALRKRPAAGVPTPSVMHVTLFVDSDGVPSLKDSDGNIVPIGSGATSLLFTDVQTSTYTAEAGEFVLTDAETIGPFSVYAPSSPAVNDRFGVKESVGSTNLVTVDGNGYTMDGLPARFVNTPYQWRVWQFNGVEWSEVGG